MRVHLRCMEIIIEKKANIGETVLMKSQSLGLCHHMQFQKLQLTMHVATTNAFTTFKSAPQRLLITSHP